MKLRRLFALSLICALAALGTGELAASICGFPGSVSVGIPPGLGYVVLFSPVAPFGLAGFSSVPLGAPAGDACFSLWREAVLGPPPPNYLAIYSAAPGVCSAAACSPGPAACAGPTFCMAFP